MAAAVTAIPSAPVPITHAARFVRRNRGRRTSKRSHRPATHADANSPASNATNSPPSIASIVRETAVYLRHASPPCRASGATSMKFRLANLAAVATALALAGPALAEAAAPDDPFVWLEELNGTRAMDWVRTENARTLKVLEADARFQKLYDDALKIAEARDRIPAPRFFDGAIFNFWQDSDHVRGIWRRTTLDDYAKPQPGWKTVLDLDAVARTENANWVWKDADCAWPDERRCLISLSDGGEDAVTVRELDVEAGRFVEGGFHLARGKQRTAWEHSSTPLVSRECEPGQLTAAGYPFIAKRPKRG